MLVSFDDHTFQVFNYVTGTSIYEFEFFKRKPIFDVQPSIECGILYPDKKDSKLAKSFDFKSFIKSKNNASFREEPRHVTSMNSSLMTAPTRHILMSPSSQQASRAIFSSKSGRNCQSPLNFESTQFLPSALVSPCQS